MMLMSTVRRLFFPPGFNVRRATVLLWVWRFAITTAVGSCPMGPVHVVTRSPSSMTPKVMLLPLASGRVLQHQLSGCGHSRNSRFCRRHHSPCYKLRSDRHSQKSDRQFQSEKLD